MELKVRKIGRDLTGQSTKIITLTHAGHSYDTGHLSSSQCKNEAIQFTEVAIKLLDGMLGKNTAVAKDLLTATIRLLEN